MTVNTPRLARTRARDQLTASRRVRAWAPTLALAAGLALAGTPGRAAAAPASEWLQAGHDAARSQSNGAEKALTPKVWKRLRQQWATQRGQFHVGPVSVAAGQGYECSNLHGLSQLALASGQAGWDWASGVPDDCQSVTLSSGQAWIAQLDRTSLRLSLSRVAADSGQLQAQVSWVDAGSLGANDPALDAGRLLVSDIRSTITAVDTTTGILRWQARTGCLNTPVAAGGGRVFVATWNGCEDGGALRLQAFDAATGAAQWQQPITNDAWYPPLLLGTRVAVGTRDGRVAAFGAADGAPKWQASLPGYIQSPLVGQGSTVYACTPTLVMALDAATGAIRWQTPVPRHASLASNLVLAAGALYATVNEIDGTQRLAMFNASTGAPAAKHPDMVFGSSAQLTVANGQVLVATSQGWVYGYGVMP